MRPPLQPYRFTSFRKNNKLITHYECAVNTETIKLLLNIYDLLHYILIIQQIKLTLHCLVFSWIIFLFIAKHIDVMLCCIWFWDDWRRPVPSFNWRMNRHDCRNLTAEILTYLILNYIRKQKEFNHSIVFSA